jgi:hypothetical protein
MVALNSDDTRTGCCPDAGILAALLTATCVSVYHRTSHFRQLIRGFGESRAIFCEDTPQPRDKPNSARTRAATTRASVLRPKYLDL